MADDPDVPNESRLFRRVPADTHHILWDDNLSCWRISSQAFRNARETEAFSVNLECVLQELGQQPSTVFPDASKYGLVALPARLVREHNQAVEKKPEPNDPSHGHVAGAKPRGVQQAFARAAQQGTEVLWVAAPQNWPWPNPRQAG